MLSRRAVRLLFFALAILLGVTAGVAQQKARRAGGADFVTEWTNLLSRPFLVSVRAVVRDTQQFVGIFRLNSSLKSQNAALRQDLLSARIRLNSAAEDHAAVQRLTALAGLRKSLPFRTCAARVLVRPSTPWNETCTIDAGSAAGVTPGSAVIVPAGLVGQVIEVHPTSSQVALLRSRQSSVACLLQGSRAPGICSGQGEDLLTMDFIPEQAAVREGDVVVSSGQGGVFPKGLRVGSVASVDTPKHYHFKKAMVRPAVEFRSVEELLVVVKPR